MFFFLIICVLNLELLLRPVVAVPMNYHPSQRTAHNKLGSEKGHMIYWRGKKSHCITADGKIEEGSAVVM